MLRKLFPVCSLFVLISAWLAPAYANEYDLELVVFLNNDDISTELPRHGSDRHARLNQNLERLITKTGSVVALPVSAGNMTELVEKLHADPAYTVLNHTTWRQQVELIADAPYIDVSPLSLGDDSTGLKGVVRFYHSPLLYVDVLLKFTPFDDPFTDEVFEPVPQPVFESEGENVIPESFFLDEKRRLRLTELHYLDSPKIGAVISAWPIEEAVE